jgi:hypothetical protein
MKTSEKCIFCGNIAKYKRLDVSANYRHKPFGFYLDPSVFDFKKYNICQKCNTIIGFMTKPEFINTFITGKIPSSYLFFIKKIIPFTKGDLKKFIDKLYLKIDNLIKIKEEKNMIKGGIFKDILNREKLNGLKTKDTKQYKQNT